MKKSPVRCLSVVASLLTLPALALGAEKAADLPKLIGGAEMTAIQKKVEAAIGQSPKGSDGKVLNSELRARLIQALSNYMSFLKLSPTQVEFDRVLKRLQASSTQFLLCDSFQKWDCLEQAPTLAPSSSMRREDPSKQLGVAVPAGAKLDIEWAFTKRWDNAQKGADHPTVLKGVDHPATVAETRTVAPLLAEKILKEGTKGVYMALYGIDDIKNSMAPVFNAIGTAVGKKVDVQGIFDAKEGARGNSSLRRYDIDFGGQAAIRPSGKLLFSFVSPSSFPNGLEESIFGRPAYMDELLSHGKEWSSEMDPILKEISKAKNDPAKVKALIAKLPIRPIENAEDPAKSVESREFKDVKWFLGAHEAESRLDTAKNAVRMAFQYNGTNQLITLMNKGITSDAKARARLEWPATAIMHNKFFVFKRPPAPGSKDDQLSVWSGTTNVARTCMGDEVNANMAIFVKNTPVALTFMEEFKEMYEYDPTNPSAKPGEKFKLAPGQTSLPIGRTHTAKRANTKRYFTFTDGTEVRVHFSPTDDGEHRAIIPMLLSAKENDIIRVAMFGGAGHELVRAFQYAAAQGADIQLSFDLLTGSQPGALAFNKVANLTQENPFDKKDGKTKPIEVRLSGWRGLNHHKTAVLLRYAGVVNGKKAHRPEILIVGSQNWTSGGNDSNDENMVTIRNPKGLAVAKAFYDEFKSNIWPASTVTPYEAKNKPPKSGDEDEEEAEE